MSLVFPIQGCNHWVGQRRQLPPPPEKNKQMNKKFREKTYNKMLGSSLYIYGVTLSQYYVSIRISNRSVCRIITLIEKEPSYRIIFYLVKNYLLIRI